MAVTPKLRLVIEFLNPQAEYRFKHFYKQQELKLDLGNCEIFTARLVSMQEAPREIDITFIEECNSIGEQIADRLSNIVAISSMMTNPGMKEYLNITPTWTVVIRNADTGIIDSYDIAKCLSTTFFEVLASRGYNLEELVLSSIHENTLNFLQATDIKARCKAMHIRPLDYDLIFDKWHKPTS